MTKLLTALLAGALIVAVATPASALRVVRRQFRQAHRIERGVRSGRLTPREAARLRQQQGAVARQRAAAMADGHISRRERVKLRHHQNRTGRAIFRKKHNRRRVWH